mgnify:FL=1
MGALMGAMPLTSKIEAIDNSFHMETYDQILTNHGISLLAPEGAENILYYAMEDGTENQIFQVSFTKDGKNYDYRTQKTTEISAYNMSGIFFSPEEELNIQLGNATATLLMSENNASAYWLDVISGQNYSLGCIDGASQEEMMAIAEAVFSPRKTQEGFMAGMTKSFNGTFIDENDGHHNTIQLTLQPDGHYDADITLYRLCMMQGTGNTVDGAIELALTDPSDGTLYGIFYDNGADGYTFKVTYSTWDFLPEGTAFEGFLMEAE